MSRWNRANQIDSRFMASWYVELPLTGLVETLAEAQLFGAVKGAFTGATDRAEIFEQASTGRISTSDPSLAAQVTGGVVFLDEIGDLSESLQAKLLPVLSGGAFYRVGAEGRATLISNSMESQSQHLGNNWTRGSFAPTSIPGSLPA